MGTARSTFFTFASVLIILAGLGGLILDGIIVYDRWYNINSSVLLLAPSAVLILAAAVLNIIIGISGLYSRNKRTNSALIVRLPEISLSLCVIAFILLFINGVLLWHFGVLFVVELLIPLLFIFSAVKKSYS